MKIDDHSKDSTSAIEPFVSVLNTRQEQMNMSSSPKEKYQICTQDFDTFNIHSLSQKPETSKNMNKLGNVINDNLNRSSVESNSHDRYANITRYHQSFEASPKYDDADHDINHTLPVDYSRANLCHTAPCESYEKYDIPSWKTGAQPKSSYKSNKIDQSQFEQMQNGSMSQVLSRLTQLEYRMKSTDDKIRITQEITQLKQGEKNLAHSLGKSLSHMYRGRAI